jgi:hypothetical protein
MKEDASYGGSEKISNKRVSLEDVVSEIQIVLHIISENLIEEHMGTSGSISFVETQKALAKKALYALHVVSVHRRSVGLIQTYEIETSDAYQLNQRPSLDQL